MDFINPNEILSQIGISESAIAADLGCGSGGWAIPLAKIADKGKVFAVDIQEEPLSALKSKASLSGVKNIKGILGNAEEKIKEIADYSCDFVLLANILFQAENKEAVIREAKRILSPEGKLLIVDWKSGAPIGAREKAVSSEEAREMAEKEGFLFLNDFPAGVYHYALLFKKND